MRVTPHPVQLALQIMEDWLDLPEHQYKATVYLFSRKLPPDQVLEAVEIAHAKLPHGGTEAFRYFCGVCHRKIEERRIWLEWN